MSLQQAFIQENGNWLWEMAVDQNDAIAEILMEDFQWVQHNTKITSQLLQ